MGDWTTLGVDRELPGGGDSSGDTWRVELGPDMKVNNGIQERKQKQESKEVLLI